jgi:SAM-dependent methyltransferase
MTTGADDGDEGTRNRAARAAWAGGDQGYLRDVQYADSTKLAARANLHAKYGRATWFPWWAAQLPWPSPGDGANLQVLEVGCGAAWLWAEATDQMPAERIELTLTDLSPGMVDEAVERVAGLGRFAGVEGRTADAQDVPFADDSFDVVVSNHMLYHLPEPALGVAEIARVLRPGGVVGVATNGWTHLTELWQIRAEVFAGLGDRTHHDETVEAFGIETGEPMLRERFGSVTFHRYDDTLRCTDPADVVAFLRSNPPGEDADAAGVARLRAAVDQRFAAGDGVFEVTKNCGLFVCTDPR